MADKTLFAILKLQKRKSIKTTVESASVRSSFNCVKVGGKNTCKPSKNVGNYSFVCYHRIWRSVQFRKWTCIDTSHGLDVMAAIQMHHRL